jgi:outer membrane protein
MKKIFLSITALLTFSLLQAQTSQGTLFIGGGLGISAGGGKTESKTGSTTVSTDNPKTTSLSISPGIGYFIADNLAIGLDFNVGVNTSKTKGTNFTNTKTGTSLGVSPFIKYYKMVNDNFGFTGAFSVQVSSQKTKEKYESGSTSTTSDGPKYSNLGIGITPGFVFFPSEKIGIEANFGFLGYQSVKNEYQANTNTRVTYTSNSFGLNATTFTPAFQLGFRYYLGK